MQHKTVLKGKFLSFLPKRQTADIKFTHRPKLRFFAPQGRLVAPIHVKLGRADGHVGPLTCAKFDLNRPWRLRSNFAQVSGPTKSVKGVTLAG